MVCRIAGRGRSLAHPAAAVRGQGARGAGRAVATGPGRPARRWTRARAEVLGRARCGTWRRPGRRRALDRYTGVLYRELDAASLSTTARRRLTGSTLIASGLWGWSGPTTPSRPTGSRWRASLHPGSGSWRPGGARTSPPRSPSLAGRARSCGTCCPTSTPRPGTRPRCPWPGASPSGSPRPRTRRCRHWNKLLKGSLVRHLAATGLTDHRGLAAFHHPSGYRYDPASTITDGRAHQHRPARVLQSAASAWALAQR